MTDEHNALRRKLLAALPALTLFSGTVSSAAEGDPGTESNDTLITYFSRTGNTRVVAGLLQRNLSAHIHEISPLTPYPADYLETVEIARQERDAGSLRPIRKRLTNISTYKTIYIGFPIWGTSVPSVIKTFLRTHDLKGVTVIPFITHGGFGIGDSMDILNKLCPSSNLLDPFVMQADQERKTMESVESWLSHNHTKISDS